MNTASALPIWREARKVRPGWWVQAADGEWCEVRMVLTTNLGRKSLVFADGEQSGYFAGSESLPTLGIREAKAAGLGEAN